MAVTATSCFLVRIFMARTHEKWREMIITAKVIAVCEHASLKLNIKVPLPFPSFVVCHDFKTMFVFHLNEHESEKFLTTLNELARAWHEFVHV